MQPPIYNYHRLPPASAPMPSVLAGAVTGTGNTRLLELLEAVKNEFETAGAEGGQWRVQRDEYEGKIQSQISELGLIRQSLYELENKHNQVRQEYEAEIARLRREVDTLRASKAADGDSSTSANHLDLPPKGPAPQLPMPEGVREGMPTGLPGPPLNGQAGGIGGLGLESGDNRSQYPPQSHPHRPTSVPAGSDRKAPASTDRDRERERERERERDQRDPRDTHYRQSEQPNPNLGAARERERDSHRPSLPPMAPAPAAAPPGNGAMVPASPPVLLSDLDPDNVSRELKKEGSDWFAVWSSQSKKILDVGLVHTLNHETVVCCVKFSNDGKFLATGCNRTAQIYDVKTGGKVCVLLDEQTTRSGDLYIRSICFSPDGKYLATGAEDRQIRIWDIKQKRIRHLLQGHMQEIYSLDFSRDGRFLVSGSGDKSARIWDIEKGVCVFDLKIEDFIHNEHGPIDAGITSVALSPDGKLVAAGSLDTMVRVWNVATGQQVERLKGHKDSVYSVAFSPDGKSLVSGSLDRTLRVWDLSQTKRAVENMQIGSKDVEKGLGTCQSTLNGHKDYVLSVAISPDGQWVVSGSKDRSIQFWNIATGQAQFMLQGHKNSVISIDLARSGNHLASGSGDCMARIWKYEASS